MSICELHAQLQSVNGPDDTFCAWHQDLYDSVPASDADSVASLILLSSNPKHISDVQA